MDFPGPDLEGLTITLEEDGNTLLTGTVFDQVALFGLLKKMRDLGMPLVSVTIVEPDQENSQPSGSYFDATLTHLLLTSIWLR